MKKWIILLIILSIFATTILIGCSADKEITSTEPQVSKEVNQTSKKESILPKDLSNIFGKTYNELKNEKGNGKEEYLYNGDIKYLSSLTYNENWFNWNEKVQATYIGNSPDEDKIIDIILRFPDGTDRDKLIKNISKYLGKAQEKDGGECCKYSAQWEKDDLSYFIADYGYLEMYINKKQ